MERAGVLYRSVARARNAIVTERARASSLPLSPSLFQRTSFPTMPTADDFFAIDMRVGTVLDASPFPEARKPSLRLTIDFGPELGVKRSSAQLTVRYRPEELVGRQIVAAVNIGTRRIAGLTSEVLVLGAMPNATEVVLLAVERPVANGTRIG